MEYEQKLVSLYDESPLPKMFISIEKKAKGILICLKSSKKVSGYLLVWINGRIIKKEVESESFLLLPKWVNFLDDFVFVFFSDGKKYVGCTNKNESFSIFIDKASEIYQNYTIQKGKTYELDYDKEEIVSNIINKIFGFRCLSFFEQTKTQLSVLFSCYVRAVEIEKKIPFSKFVSSGEEGEKSYVGIVYKNNLPFAVGVGFEMGYENHMISDVSYQLFYKEKSSKKHDFVCFTFRSCFDGENIWLK